MKCPRCETTTLDERDRDGVVLDVCRQCRGIWLDRGELEKLIARATRDMDELEQHYRPAPAPAPRAQEPAYAPPPDPGYASRRRDSDPDYRHHDPRYRHHRKKSFMEQLGDLFD